MLPISQTVDAYLKLTRLNGFPIGTMVIFWPGGAPDMLLVVVDVKLTYVVQRSGWPWQRTW
jgi:hypothetical protein